MRSSRPMRSSVAQGIITARSSRLATVSDTGTWLRRPDVGSAGAGEPPFKFSARTRVGFSDTDAQGVVYYGRYNPYFDLARVDTSAARAPARPGQRRLRDARERRRVLRPRSFDDELEVYARVSRIGRTSVTFEFAAYKVPDDVLLVTAHQTLVYVDLGERQARPVPEDYRPRRRLRGRRCRA